jgi:hypothetical protein
MDRLRVLRGGRLVSIERERGDWLGITISAVAGLGLGLVAGMAFGEFFSEVDPGRVTGAVKRLKRRRAEPVTPPEEIERAVNGALGENPQTRHLDVRARALGEGIVEITGTVPDAAARTHAATVARGVAGTYVVVNRVLVEGDDVPRRKAASSTAV